MTNKKNSQLQNFLRRIYNIFISIPNFSPHHFTYDLYEKHIRFIESKIFYKFLKEQYDNLFSKKIFDDRKKFIDKYEILFAKINQDIQFLKSFDFDNTIPLNLTIKNDFKTKFEKRFKDDLIIEDFLKETKILKEINNILIEFEVELNEKIKIRENNANLVSDLKKTMKKFLKIIMRM